VSAQAATGDVAQALDGVFSVHDEAGGMADDDVLAKAHAENRILINNDKDFGEMVFRERARHHGVILLRLQDERMASKAGALRTVLTSYANQLPDAFVVVTEAQVRFATT
jgi:predicted nuclease of predicted toxin-antitoxin system